MQRSSFIKLAKIGIGLLIFATLSYFIYAFCEEKLILYRLRHSGYKIGYITKRDAYVCNVGPAQMRQLENTNSLPHALIRNLSQTGYGVIITEFDQGKEIKECFIGPSSTPGEMEQALSRRPQEFVPNP